MPLPSTNGLQQFTVPVARGAEGTVTARIDVLDPEDFRTYASEDLKEPVPLPLPSSGVGDAGWSVADLLDHISDYFGRSQAKDGADRREKGFASHQNLTERTVRVLVYSFDRNPAPTLRFAAEEQGGLVEVPVTRPEGYVRPHTEAVHVFRFNEEGASNDPILVDGPRENFLVDVSFAIEDGASHEAPAGSVFLEFKNLRAWRVPA